MLAKGVLGSHWLLLSNMHYRIIKVSMIIVWMDYSYWRHQMEIFSALLAHCAGNSPVTGEFPAQWPVTQSFDVFFNLCLNKRLSKQSRGWWFETPSRPLWRHCNVKTASRIIISYSIYWDWETYLWRAQNCSSNKFITDTNFDIYAWDKDWRK